MVWWKWKSDTQVEVQAAFAAQLFGRLTEEAAKSSDPIAQNLARDARECLAADPILGERPKPASREHLKTSQ